MSFEVAAETYDRYMGRYSSQLSPQLADLAGIHEGQRALDVGCGPGALTAVLAERLGPAAVAAVDPSASFVAAAKVRNPGVDVRQASAEALPFGDHAFDAVLAQLVVHYMSDPIAGIREMARVTRRGGVVVACVWDFAGGRSPLSTFWSAAADLDPTVTGESLYAGARQGHLGELFREAGLGDVQESVVTAQVVHPKFDDWWLPYTMGIGAGGAYSAGLDPAALEALRERCRVLLATEPFTIQAAAWVARGLV